MDMITNTQVAVTMAVPLPVERVWDLITDVGRVAEWSPEVTGARWCDGSRTAGARFTGYNRFPHGLETTVTCEVLRADRPECFAWAVLDDDGLVGSVWRYDLSAGDTPGVTVVRHSFTHGPGASGARADLPSFHERLGVIGRNIAVTVAAMGTAG